MSLYSMITHRVVLWCISTFICRTLLIVVWWPWLEEEAFMLPMCLMPSCIRDEASVSSWWRRRLDRFLRCTRLHLCRVARSGRAPFFLSLLGGEECIRWLANGNANATGHSLVRTTLFVVIDILWKLFRGIRKWWRFVYWICSFSSKEELKVLCYIGVLHRYT